MISSRDIPSELKSFWKVFERLAYRHQYVTVFDDFLTMCLFNFSLDEPEYKENRDQVMKKYETEEHKLFGELFMLMLKIYAEQIVDKGKKWYDFFGDLYQAISSTQKSQAMGQFFTPESVVDMMALMNNIQKDQTVLDPTCGSGRMLIAAHAHSGGCFVFGKDLDLMCCKMTVLNMIFHGCNGEVVWCNSLDLYDYKNGWRIKPHREIGICFISPLPKEHSFIWHENQKRIEEFQTASNPEVKKEIQEKFHDTLFPDEVLTQPTKKTKLVYKSPIVEEAILQEELF